MSITQLNNMASIISSFGLFTSALIVVQFTICMTE